MENLENKENSNSTKKTKTLLGLSVIFGLVLLQLANNVFSLGLMNTDNIPPLFLIYFNISFDVFGFMIAMMLKSNKCASRVDNVPKFTKRRVVWVGIALMFLY